MSRNSTKRKRAIERAQAGRVIPQAELQAAIMSLSNQQKKGVGKSSDALFSPGLPLETQQGANPGGLPLSWRFMPQYNSFPVDRTLGNQDIPSFEQLRNLARLYSGNAICMRVILDLVPNLKLDVVLTEEMIEGGAEPKQFQKEIATYKKLFEKPDGRRDFHSWLRVALGEQFTIDELYLYKRQTRGKTLFGLDIVDGSQMKPLIDDWGNVIGYQQYPWGIPGEQFTTQQMIRYNETPQADSLFGFSRVERIIIEVNQALRKKRKDLARYTEGNVPAGIMEVPESSTWTPDQIDAYEQMWNALLAGNAQQQVRVKFTQPGMTYTRIDDVDLNTPFDQFLLNIAAASYGLSMQDIAFTGDIHKSSGDSQQNVLGRRVLYPLTSQYAMIFTGILRTDFNDNRFQVTIGGFEEAEDKKALAEYYTNLTKSGILGLSNAGKLLNLPEDKDAPHIGRVFFTATGPIFLDDVAQPEARKAQMDATMAGFEQAQNPPEQQGGDNEQSAQNVSGKQATDKSSRANRGSELSGAIRRGGDIAERHTLLQDAQDDVTDEHSRDGNTVPRIQAEMEHDADSQDTARLAQSDIKRWRTVAINAFERGKTPREFVSTHIPVELHERITTRLSMCQSVEDVRAVFDGAKDTTSADSSWQNKEKSVQHTLQQMQVRGVKQLKWIAPPDACSGCLANHNQVRDLGSPFPTGVMIPPNHPSCQCTAEEIIE